MPVQAWMFWRSRSGQRRGPTRVACLVRNHRADARVCYNQQACVFFAHILRTHSQFFARPAELGSHLPKLPAQASARGWRWKRRTPGAAMLETRAPARADATATALRLAAACCRTGNTAASAWRRRHTQVHLAARTVCLLRLVSKQPVLHRLHSACSHKQAHLCVQKRSNLNLLCTVFCADKVLQSRRCQPGRAQGAGGPQARARARGPLRVHCAGGRAGPRAGRPRAGGPRAGAGGKQGGARAGGAWQARERSRGPWRTA